VACASSGRAVNRPPPSTLSPPAHGRLRILKFGSSVLREPASYAAAAAQIASEVGSGARVIAVVSALEGQTDALLAAARGVSADPPTHLVAALLATGEDASVSLLVMALAEAGITASTISSWRSPVRTDGPPVDSEPVGVDREALIAELNRARVLVVPGFVGIDWRSGAPTLLGRGGSDLTALALGYWLEAEEVRLLKDEDGIYPADPKRVSGLEPLAEVTCGGARRIGGEVVQEKALLYADRHGLAFRVAAPGGRGTLVTPDRPVTEAARPSARPQAA